MYCPYRQLLCLKSNPIIRMKMSKATYQLISVVLFKKASMMNGIEHLDPISITNSTISSAIYSLKHLKRTRIALLDEASPLFMFDDRRQILVSN
jgi:hypothetical protein